MKTYSDNYRLYEQAATKEPRFVAQVSWDVDDTDYTYFTSSSKAALPTGVDFIHGAVYKISGQTQKINPDIATSTIGVVKLSLLDVHENENLIRWSQQFDNAVWQKSLLSVTANQVKAPDGSFTADKIIYSGNNSLLAQGNSAGGTVGNRTFTYSVWLWTDSGQPISVSITVYSGSNSQTKNITLTEKPVRHTVSYTFPGSDLGTLINARINGPSSGVVSGEYAYGWGAQLSETGGRIPYTETESTQRTTSYPAVTTKISDKLAAGDGLRQKTVRIYVGYGDMPFTEYDLRLTYIVDSISYKDGVYSITMSDIQREERHKIFTPLETTLAENVDELTNIIPINTSDLNFFPLVRTGPLDSVSPRKHVGYVKIEEEVIQHIGILFDAGIGYYLNVSKRGALNTRAAEHRISDDATTTSSPIKVIEHIYFECPAPKAIYALQTGLYLHGNNLLGDVLPNDSFDLSTWNQFNSPTVSLSTEVSPTGWGQVWDVIDNSATLNEHIRTDEYTSALGYVHGDEYSGSIFVKKDTLDTINGSIYISFNNGAASSYGYLVYSAASGSFSLANDGTAFFFTKGSVLDYGDWWQVVVGGYSTTTGTTSATFRVFSAASATDTGSKTYFGASFQGGVRSAGMNILPLHWHLGINEKFVRLSDYKNIGIDYWNPDDDSGKIVRIENPGTQDGKKYIESQLLLWLGAFQPIYSDGDIGLRKLANVLPFTGYNLHLTETNVKSYSDLIHDMKSVVNDIRIRWNYVDSKETYTKENVLIDADSIGKHRTADTKVFEFKAVHTGAHTDENILTYFDTLRDRYSGPPLRMSLSVMPSSSSLEVGDRVRVTLPQIRNFSDITPFNQTVDRVFEVQQVNTDWTTGEMKLQLFGSSQKAGELGRTTTNSVLLDTFYTSAGTNLTSVLTITAGAVTANGTLTGNANSMDSAIYYYDGDLTINAGVTVTITENVQLRIKGTLTINGKIDGAGNGATGGTTTTQFVGGGTTDLVLTLAYLPGGYDPLKDIDFDFGEQGYLFNTIPAAALNAYGLGSLTTIQETDQFDVSSTYVDEYEYAWYGFTIQKAISEGIEEELPYFNITNDQQTNTVEGYSLDLRGNSGGGGVPLVRRGFTFGTYEALHSIVANGGSGGDGGAGLLIISRGVVFGGSGEIDLSGGPSGIGGSWTSAGGDVFYAGSGAPGAPGGLLILLDGGVTNPDIDDTVFTANFGDAVHGVGATEVDRSFFAPPGQDWNLYSVATWPHGDAVWNGAPTAALENGSATDAAHRIQYIPADITPALSEDSAPNIIYRTYKPIQFREGLPSNQAAYLGKYVTISEDNQRIAYSEGNPNFNTPKITIEAGLENGIQEMQTTLGTGEDNNASEVLAFNRTSDVFIEGRPETTSNSGNVRVWTRSINSWTNTQSITWATANDNFGRYLAMRGDGRSQGFLAGTANTATTNNRVYYFENTGASWVQQQTLNYTGQPTSSAACRNNALRMSGDANWCIFGDVNFGTANDGCAAVFQRTGTGASTWSEAAVLTIASGVSSNLLGTQVDLDSTGQTFVASSEYPISGFNLGRVEVWQRDINVFNHFQTIFGPADSIGSYNATFGRALSISDDGLTLVTSYGNSGNTNTTVQVYKRGSIDVKFKLLENIVLEDITSTYRNHIEISKNGNYIILPSPTYRTNGVTTNGLIVIFENQFNLIGS